MNKPALQNGFTLVELLIVVAIIATLTGAVLPTFNSYLQNQNVKQAQEQIRSDLRNIQNRALTGSLSDDATVQYWGVAFTNNQGTYEFITTSTTSCSDSNRTSRGFSSPLPNSLVIRSSSRCVFFNMENGDAFSTVAALNVIVGPSTGTPCRRVDFNSVGRITNSTSLLCP